jgi:hypothetical protein
MPIDPYALCPGGTGKKLKFCCSDLLGELDKIQRMFEGEQRAACLEYIESLEAKYPDRACLLSIKAMLEAQLGQETKAEATLAKFVAKYPDNPVALAEKATLAASKEGGVAGIAPLQDALEKCSEQMPPAVYDAIGMVAQSLVADNQMIAGRAHLVLQLGIGGAKDQKPLQLLVRVNNSSSVPLLAKQDLPLLPAPDDALWKNSFNEAMEPAMRGAWRLAAAQLTALAERVGDWPTIWQNVAVLRAWLADNDGAVEALRKYAAQPIPLDDAVEAEALAQSLDAEAADMVDVLSIVYEVIDSEKLQARLAANPRAMEMPIDLARMGTPDEPPPKGAWWLLDRPVPESGKDLSRPAIPQVLGQVFLFGKQTDRPARLEMIVYGTERERAQAVAGEIGGDALGSPGAQEVTTVVSALQHALNWNWRLPEDTPPEKRLALVDEERREMLFNRWPDMPQKLFGGRTARQAAADPAERIKVLAAILLLELATEQVTEDVDFNQLRRSLGLPAQETIDPTSISLNELPLVRFSRIDPKRLSDDALLDLYRRADHYRHVAALRKLAPEVVARPSLADKIDKAEVYGVLAQIEPDTERALGYLDQARKAAEAAKASTAPWDLAELAMRIARGDIADADRLLNHIRNDHIREPGVAQALYQILMEAGIIGPDGKPAMPAPAREAAGIVVPGGAASEAGKIWTPGGDQPAGGKKSALWTPDMD